MTFKKELVFLGSKEFVTKDNKKVRFTTLVDIENYDKEDFFTDLSLDLSSLNRGDKASFVFDFSSFNGRNYMTLKGVVNE